MEMAIKEANRYHQVHSPSNMTHSPYATPVIILQLCQSLLENGH